MLDEFLQWFAVNQKWMWFGLFVLLMLALDLGVFHRQPHAIKLKEALLWSAMWIALALLFSAFVYCWRGKDTALEFITCYLIEKSLSADNLFVFLLLFGYFKVEDKYQHRVLFWGILGALVLRAALIATGVTLIRKFGAVIYVFGVLLIIGGVRMALKKGKKVDPDKNLVLKLVRWFTPVTQQYEGGKFLVHRAGRRHATPLLVALIVVETTDLIFALDSIPAVLAITHHAFIVYTSNVFAILGLRSLYFALAGTMHRFHRLPYGLAVILVFVGVKMLLRYRLHIPVAAALTFVAVVLVISIIASLVWPRKQNGEQRCGAEQLH